MAVTVYIFAVYKIMYSATNADAELADEDRYRAGTYALLAGLLVGPPSPPLLQRLHAIEADADDAGEHDLPGAWRRLQQATVAEGNDGATLDDEYHALFIGVGRGELVPFGSWYITGFLMEKPLAALRQDLARLGFERQQGVYEPEDHIAALCEVMAQLITDGALPFASQRQFFDRHLAPWAEAFFADLQNAKSARFYRAVGELGLAFIRTEKQALAMAV